MVVIIDEYDKPILDLINKPEEIEAVRQSLQSFYSVLKAQESNLRLVFITGLYKFTEMSMFSTLNETFLWICRQESWLVIPRARLRNTFAIT